MCLEVLFLYQVRKKERQKGRVEGLKGILVLSPLYRFLYVVRVFLDKLVESLLQGLGRIEGRDCVAFHRVSVPVFDCVFVVLWVAPLDFLQGVALVFDGVAARPC